MTSMENPWLRPLQVVRQVVEFAAKDAVLIPSAWRKEPGNTYVTLFPVGVMPPLRKPNDLLDEDAWGRVWSEIVLGSSAGNTLSTFVPSAGAWSVAEWCAADTGRSLGVIRPGRSDSIRTAARLWLRLMDLEWLRSFDRNPEISADLILEWLDRILDVLAADPTAGLTFRPYSPLGMMLVEVEGIRTPHDEVWWPGYESYSQMW